jgi:hypothetical protein
MQIQRVVCLSLFVLAGADCVHAQWVPVTAKTRQTNETWQEGKLIKVDHKEGVFYRTSDGSTLRYWTKVNGDEVLGGSGEMTDNNSLSHYSVNVKQKVAFETDKLLEKLTPGASQYAAASTLGDQVIEGIRCRRVPSFMMWPDGRKERMGEVCVSIEYDLELHKDNQLTQNGITHHAVTELYDIKLGVEPDPKLFDLQKTTTVYKPQAPDTQPKP